MTTPALIPFSGSVELVTLSAKLPALFLAAALFLQVLSLDLPEFHAE
jgi:hypothetical protein